LIRSLPLRGWKLIEDVEFHSIESRFHRARGRSLRFLRPSASRLGLYAYPP
jgi:hypothetical protein